MPTSVDIRVAHSGDEHALALLGSATFLESYAEVLDGAAIVAHCARQHAAGVYASWLNDAACQTWLAIATPGGAPVGYLVLGPADIPAPDPDPSDLEIKRIYLLSRFHGHGLGRRLIDLAKAEARARGARRLLLGVFSQNERAIGFYKHLGFTAVGTRLYEVGHRTYDDFVLALSLDAG